MPLILYSKYVKGTCYYLFPILLWLVTLSHGFSQIQWSKISSCERCGEYYDVTYGNGKWITVGSSGKILTSSDRLTWTERNCPTTEDLLSIDYGAGQWIAVGTNGAIVTSADGTTWTLRPTDPANRLNSVSYGAGLWIAAGKTNNIRVQYGIYFTSPDGINWTYRPQAGSLSYTLNHVSYLNGAWFLLGGDGLFTSTDGLDWSRREVQTRNSLSSIAYGAENYLVSTSEGEFIKSADGINWTLSRSNTGLRIADLSYGAGRWVAVGSGANPNIITSLDGINWTSSGYPANGNLNGVQFVDSSGVVVGRDNIILTTTSLCTSTQSGDWGNPTTWSCGRVPTGLDVVMINPGHTITTINNGTQALRVNYNGGKMSFSNQSNMLIRAQ